MEYSHLFTAFQKDQRLKITDDIISFTYHHIGNLVIASGSILACDPYFCSEAHPFMAESIPLGMYPVILAVAHFDNTDQRVAFAMLQINENLPIKWMPASFSNGMMTGSEEYAYSVDSGMGSFMDAKIASECVKMLGRSENEKLIDNQLKKTYTHTWAWASIVIDQVTKANIICFSSGWGDGYYSSYLGYDKDANITCLVTDFSVLIKEE